MPKVKRMMPLCNLVVCLMLNTACSDTVAGPEPTSEGGEGHPLATGRLPELPRAFVDLSNPSLSGKVIKVGAGGDFQAALNAASAGDVIELEAAATFTGPFTLPPRTGTGYVVIRSSRLSQLSAGNRVAPKDSIHMARLTGGAANKRVLTAPDGAHGYWIEGIEIVALPSPELPGVLNALVDLSLGSSRIVFDRSIVRGRADTNAQRCVILNNASSAVVNSWLGDCHADGFDSQAIIGWQGPGPYHIENNYLAGAGENVMFGGARLGPDGFVPSDIVIRRNHIHKPLSWQGRWTVKNLLELKIARRVLVEGNVLENVWPNAQVGFAVNIKSENRDTADHPNIATEDVTFRNNRILNATHGFTIIGGASTQAKTGDGFTARILIENNEIQLTGSRGWQVGNVPDLLIHHNTMHGNLLLEGTLPGFVFSNNLVYGYAKGSGIPMGAGAFEQRAPGATVTGNVFITDESAAYPEGNLRLPVGERYSGRAGADQSRLQTATVSVAF